MPKKPKEIELKSKNYDKLKPVVQLWLPALATLYFTLSQIWGLPAAEEVVGTIAAVVTFLGAVLGISAKNYNKHKDGSFVVNETDPMKDTYSLEIDTPMEQIPKNKEVRLRVRNDSQKNHGL